MFIGRKTRCCIGLVSFPQGGWLGLQSNLLKENLTYFDWISHRRILPEICLKYNILNIHMFNYISHKQQNHIARDRFRLYSEAIIRSGIAKKHFKNRKIYDG